MDYIDSDWEDDGFNDEFEWYIEYGRGEAEDDIIASIVEEFGIPDDLYLQFIEGLKEIFPALMV